MRHNGSFKFNLNNTNEIIIQLDEPSGDRSESLAPSIPKPFRIQFSGVLSHRGQSNRTTATGDSNDMKSVFLVSCDILEDDSTLFCLASQLRSTLLPSRLVACFRVEDVFSQPLLYLYLSRVCCCRSGCSELSLIYLASTSSEHQFFLHINILCSVIIYVAVIELFSTSKI